jgi:hypothetical protein
LAHKVPRRPQVQIRRILDRREPGLFDDPQEILPGNVQERADHGAMDRTDAAEPLPAAAEEQAEEDRLGLVVPVMRGGDPAGVLALADFLEEGVAHPAGGGLGALRG